MVNEIYMNGGRKMARPVNNREEYIARRNAAANVKSFCDARAGDAKAKARQVQYNYGDLLPDGVLKGCCHPSSTFPHDIDCNSPEEQERIRQILIEKKDEIGLLELSGSANYGLHAVCRRQRGRTILECQVKVALLTQTEMDTSAHDQQRVLYTGPATEDNLFYLDDALFEEPMTIEESEAEYNLLKEREAHGEEEVPPGAKKANKHYRPWEEWSEAPNEELGVKNEELEDSPVGCEEYEGIPYSAIIAKWWELYNDGKEPIEQNRDMLTFELAVNLRHICGFNRELMGKVIPCYDRFPEAQKMKCIDSALAEKRTQMPKRLKDVLTELRRNHVTEEPSLCDTTLVEEPEDYYGRLPKMPQGVKDSVDAVGPQLAMPALVAVAPVIGMLATGVKLDVHGVKNTLNLIAYVAGDFASGKGSIDPLIEAWTHEVSAIERVYQQQMDEWRAKKLAAKNKKDQPEEPKLPIRLLTLNNTVANLAEMLARTDGRHAFSFTPEADTVAQKWKASVNDFSVMLRQSYDGSRYDREARSAEAVNVHIDHLLWNVTMCGTPDALYRVVANYTDGFQSRIALARTPDNTFAPLEEKPYILTERQAERIHQVAHLLPLMQGDVVLPKLEEKGREWLERVRMESMMSDDKTKARQRFRICVTTQRITCCIMLCRVADQLIAQYGFSGAEKQLKLHPDLWAKMLKKVQTPQLLEVFNVVADYLMDCALYFFRERIENAFSSRDYVGTADRQRMGKNDSIFARLDFDFSFEAALQQSIAVKGANVSRNAVQQMLKNWRKQGLIVQAEKGRFKKLCERS
ncbi:MAG: DUF3987 domain-containing protein [Prevotella sp.]|nr:DUF3987 domain-containing protein [Prevotella sp.]